VGASGRKAKVEAEIRKDDNKVRTSRGISKEVWEARPYTRWTKDDVSPIAEAYAGLAGSQINFMKNLAGQQDGWIINRHAVEGAPHVWPEIRPDDKVRTGPPTMHWHGLGEAPDLPAGYEVLKRGSEAWWLHCEKVNADENAPAAYKPHEAYHEMHWHDNKAKYVFPAAKKELREWWHNHEEGGTKAYYDSDPEALEKHLEHFHVDEPETRADGKHLHHRRVKSEESLARRLDIHPMAAPLLEGARTVYFGLEGCLKADAILSAILREGRRESVFSVPSVSLWAADELEGFCKQLRGKRVIIVPDGDWFQKRQVLAHARFAQRFLKNRGIDALIAAPPLASGYKGVDDFLGAGGYLDDLEVLDRTHSSELPRIVEFRKKDARADAHRTMQRMIYDLAFFADEDGYVQVGHRTMGKILRVGKSTVTDRLQTMRDWAWIEIEQLNAAGEWELCTEGVPIRSGYVSGGMFFSGPIQFKRKTRIRVHEWLRCEDTPTRPLSDVLGFRAA
jgi:hypothetical protein